MSSSADPAPYALANASHGKDQIRVARVKRFEDGRHALVELIVTVRLYGGSDNAFTDGDNSTVVATDTCRNHVYLHAKTLGFSTPDLFALTLAERMLRVYTHIERVQIDAVERPWERFERHGTSHPHAFIVKEAGHCAARVRADRQYVQHTSMLQGVTVVKTTQSGFTGFIRDTYTSLPETKDRLLATTINAEWVYTANTFEELKDMRVHNFEFLHQNMRDALLFTFFGPAPGGTYSPGLQKTLYQMAAAGLQKCPEVDSVTLSLPNIHFLPCDVPVMRRVNRPLDSLIYIPTDEPHGIIKATLERTRRAKL